MSEWITENGGVAPPGGSIASYSVRKGFSYRSELCYLVAKPVVRDNLQTWSLPRQKRIQPSKWSRHHPSKNLVEENEVESASRDSAQDAVAKVSYRSSTEVRF